MTDQQSPNQERGMSRERELIGETIAGKYRVLRILGRGGFGVVYLVEMTAGLLGEQLAMKVLRNEYGVDEERRSHFLNEIRLAMKLVNK